MKKSFLASCIFLLAAAACSPRAATTPTTPKIRVGKTVTTNCLEEAPIFDDDPTHIAKVSDHTIDRICILGTASDESRATIAHALAIHEGDKVDLDKVRSSLQALVTLPIVEDAAIGADIRGDDVIVYVNVRERPRVDEVVFHGATVFGDAKLNNKNPIAHGAPLDRRVVAAVVRAMTEEYASVGYGAASIETSVEPSSSGPNQVIVRFTINEGVQWNLRTLTFRGASKVPYADLLTASSLAVGSMYNADKVARATLLVQSLYYDRGMLNSRIQDPVRDVALDGGVTLTWPVTEGDVFRLSSLRFGKLGAPMQKDLIKEMKTKVGDVFDRSKLMADIAHLKQLFDAHGQNVDIQPLTELMPAKKQVEIILNIEDAH